MSDATLADGPPRRGFWPLRDLPVVGWLVAAVALIVARPAVDVPPWLLLHVLLLGAVSHAILVWSRHFTDAVLRAAPVNDRRQQSTRLLLLNAGAATVMVGVLTHRWAATVTGATAVATAVGWHGAALAAQLRRSLPARFAVTVRYYLFAAALLPVGATLGVLLARDSEGEVHERLVVAHAATNLLGWIGLTVLGTLVTLWPTILRTQVVEGAERAARKALPLLVASLLVAVVAALVGVRLALLAGIAGYLGGLTVAARPLAREAVRRPPTSYAALSVLAALSWLAGCLVALCVAVATAPSFLVIGDRFGTIAPFLVAGFAVQVLLGALSYLVPMALGGGPTPVRVTAAVLDAAAHLRVAVVNTGLLVCALPVPGAVRAAGAAAVVAALAAFLPLLVVGMRAGRRAKNIPVAERVSGASQ